MLSFLGLASYYRKYVKDFSTLPKEQHSFDQLKNCLTTDPVLALPDFDRPFRVECDASNYGIGAVLSQQYGKDWKPVCYYSKHLSSTQQRYSTSERELLAIVLAIEHFRQFLHGTTFTVLTDHQPLRALLTAESPSARLSRWLTRMQLFDFVIEYRSGKNNNNADGLSRLTDPDTAESDFSDLMGVRINAIRIAAEKLDQTQLLDPDLKWFYDLKVAFKDRPLEKPTFIEPLTHDQRSLFQQWNRIRISGKNLYREWVDENDHLTLQYIVPKDQRALFLEQAHDSKFSGHLGTDKTRERLRIRCYWPDQHKQVKDYVSSCTVCQTIKNPRVYNNEQLIPIRPSRPLEIVTSDMVGPLPKSGDFKYIFVIIDHFTKWVEIYPITDKSAEESAQIFMTYFCRHGIPESILTDQGTNYQSRLIEELYELLDIKRLRTTPYHPQTDGITERFNRTMKQTLTAYVEKSGENWVKYLPYVQFAYNTSVHDTTKCTPYELMYGRRPKIPLDLFCEHIEPDLQLTPDLYANAVSAELKRAYKTVISNRDKQMDHAKVLHDRHIRPSAYVPGDFVYMLDETVKRGECPKFKRKWIGPFVVIKKVNEVDYQIKPKDRKGKSRTCHANRLKRHFSPKERTLNPVKQEPTDKNKNG